MFRKTMLAGLMAFTALGAVAPAYAQRGDNQSGWDRSRSEGRQRGGEARPDGARNERGQQGGQMRGDRGAQWRAAQAQPAPRPQVQPPVQQQRAPEARRQWQQGHRPTQQTVQPTQRNQPGYWRQEGRNDAPDTRRNQTRNDWRNHDRNGRSNDWRNDRPSNGWSNNSNNGRWQNGSRRYDDRTRWSNQHRWDNSWRNDRRYDWQSYRSRYGDRYRANRYYAPSGWDYGYRRFSVGIFLSNMLYANNYWLNDPYSYRLPPAYGTLRWVRYYDDALLVDIRDGYVVDVIHDFFY